MAGGNTMTVTGSWYDLDMNRLIILLMPINWRKPKMIALLQSLAAPLRQLHYDFWLNRRQNLYKVRHNFMICYLQAALNDEFDPQLRRIVIEEPEVFANRYIYTSGELKPRYLGVMYLRTSEELGDTGVDFTVNMNGVFADIYDVRGLVDFYKLAGPRYKVINLTGWEATP
ncbi:MAG: hypothetical protein H3C36_06240 [Chitinophagaceae bacterium]|nr:hypothetical protein [Chitinophagaceae bacterium]